jgi:hypothetical protein
LRDRRICFAFSTRKQQILRCAQDDTRGEQFFQQPVDEASAWNPPELWWVRRLGCGAPRSVDKADVETQGLTNSRTSCG